MGFNSGFKGLKQYTFRTVMFMFCVQVSQVGYSILDWGGGGEGK